MVECYPLAYRLRPARLFEIAAAICLHRRNRHAYSYGQLTLVGPKINPVMGPFTRPDNYAGPEGGCPDCEKLGPAVSLCGASVPLSVNIVCRHTYDLPELAVIHFPFWKSQLSAGIVLEAVPCLRGIQRLCVRDSEVPWRTVCVAFVLLRWLSLF